MSTRTFLALPLDEAILRGLVAVQRKLARVGADVRWVEPENLHVTVKFLGGVEDAALADVCNVAEQIAAQIEPFGLEIRGVGAQPPAGQLRMVWAGIDDPDGGLGRLNDLAERAYAGLGFKQELRQYHPHLTLGRVKTGRKVDALRQVIAELADTDFGRQGADDLLVFASRLTPQGPVYSPMKTIRLG